MKTYWNTSVSIDGRTVCSSGDSALSAALSRAISDCVYYQAVYPDGKIAICEISESCAGCHNARETKIRRPRSFKMVRCKGNGAMGRMDDIAFVMPDPANRITLAMSEAKEGAHAI